MPFKEKKMGEHARLVKSDEANLMSSVNVVLHDTFVCY